MEANLIKLNPLQVSAQPYKNRMRHMGDHFAYKPVQSENILWDEIFWETQTQVQLRMDELRQQDE